MKSCVYGRIRTYFDAQPYAEEICRQGSEQCDAMDFAAMRTAKSLTGLFALDTMEQVAEFDYDNVSGFLMYDDDRKFIIPTWKGSYAG